MSELIENIKQLYTIYGDKIDSDKKLMLLYWMKIDKCDVSKNGVSTNDFINKATDPMKLLSGIRALKVMNEI